MSNDKITGVFVRLPLSDDQKEAFYARHYTGDPTPGMLVIGTPVTGDALDIIGYADNREIGAFSPSADVNPCAVIFAEEITSHNIPLVRQSDHQAALAAAQAEIVRLREHLTSCTANLENVMTKMGDWCGENGPPEYLGPKEVMSAMDAYETGKEALKGPEA